MRQRGGKTVTHVVKHEAEAVPVIRRRVARGSIVHADEARAWDDLHASFEMKRIDHGQAYSANGACTAMVFVWSNLVEGEPHFTLSSVTSTAIDNAA